MLSELENSFEILNMQNLQYLISSLLRTQNIFFKLCQFRSNRDSSFIVYITISSVQNLLYKARNQ